VHNNLAIALEAQGRVAEALGHYEEALRLKPDDARAHKNLGITLYEQGRFDEAIPHFEASLRSRPDDQSLRNLLREARARRGESGS
jgi:Flp pilus assembly protein TadD